MAKQPLQAALHYTALGYSVFPCAPWRKEPITPRGCHDATSDAAQVTKWWEHWPTANVAISTQGLIVVDVDAGSPWLSVEDGCLTTLAHAPLSLTPGGGCHYLFRQPTGRSWRNTVGRLAPHVDTRADGGYIVVPPSVLDGAGIYRWSTVLEVCPADLPLPPDWLTTQLDELAAGGRGRPNDGDTGSLGNNIPSGQRNATLARLGGTMRRVGMSQAEIMAALLRANSDRCQPPLPEAEVGRIATSVARYAADQISVAFAENHWEQLHTDTAVTVTPPADPGEVPDHLLSVPGFIDAVIQHTLATAPYPEPVLAFCGALSLQALLAGRKVCDESDSRTNLYLLGLANSGTGKDHPRKVNQQILVEAGLSTSFGDAFASGEGIEDRLLNDPAVLFQTDEIDGMMRRVNQAKDGRHEAIMNVLLKMYSSGNSVYPLRVKAGGLQTVIDQPCLCIFGTAIPKHYYEALSIRMLTNGFLARTLVLECRRRGTGQDPVAQPIPTTVIEAATWWAEFRPGHGGNLATWHPQPQVVSATPEARDIFTGLRQVANVYYSRAETEDDVVAMSIWARAYEKARRLALVYACSVNRDELQVTAAAARWAAELVEYQTRRMLFMVDDYVSENEFDARCKAVVATLRRWRELHGDAWMPFWQLNR